MEVVQARVGTKKGAASGSYRAEALHAPCSPPASPSCHTDISASDPPIPVVSSASPFPPQILSNKALCCHFLCIKIVLRNQMAIAHQLQLFATLLSKRWRMRHPPGEETGGAGRNLLGRAGANISAPGFVGEPDGSIISMNVAIRVRDLSPPKCLTHFDSWLREM